MAKKSKNLLPKKIAGVKVPKTVRKGRFGEFLVSPAGQKLIAEAIVAAGAVAGAKKVKDSDKARDKFADVADRLQNLGDGAGKNASAAGGAIAYALGEAARSFADALQRHRSEDEPDMEARKRDAELAGDSKKKPISYEAGPV
jgi:hypothetical protein